MRIKENIVYCLKYALPLTFAVLCACAESDEVIRLKLDIILKDDMEAILEGVYEGGLLETPYFELIEYRDFDEGALSRLAIADFYFLNPVEEATVMIKRKYRYYKRMGMWDRYYNRYYVIRDLANETEN